MHATSVLRRPLVLAVLALGLAGCQMLPGAMGGGGSGTQLGATLSGAAEVPPNASAGTGTAEATYDKSSGTLKYRVTYSGLSGPVTAGHFHGPAMPGQNAGVVVPFKSTANPIEGEATITPEQAADMLAGKWYANLHTAASPGGEVRGQLTTK